MVKRRERRQQGRRSRRERRRAALRGIGGAAAGTLLACAVGTLSSCDRAERQETPAAQVDESTEHPQVHSPWYLRMEGTGPFRTVTFKDVGMNRPHLDADDPMLEVIAASLAMTLASFEELGMSPGVEYDASLIDPMNHTFCEHHHLYVDLWRGDAPARWGYSLWSGCNDHDQFAWHELETAVDEALDVVDEVAPLTEHIVASLRDAMERDCYKRHC